MKVRFWIITLLLCLALTPLAKATAEGEVRQISYRLQIVELSSTDAKILGITVPEPLDVLDFGVSSVTRFVHSPNLIQILQSVTSLFQIAATREQSQMARLAEPHLTVAVGEKGKFALRHEEWVVNKGEGTLSERLFGLELLISPIRVDGQGDSILTNIELSTAAPENSLLTSVWTKSGELEAIGVMSYQITAEEKGLGRSVEKSETRYFAVYLEAQPVTLLAQTPTVNVGSLGGLPSLLWVKSPELKPSIAKISLPIKPLAWPELDLSLWLNKSFRLELVTETGAGHYHLDLGGAVGGGQELTLNAQLLRDASRAYLALGATDRVQVHPSLTLSAGVYPVVFDLGEKKLAKGGYWWGEVELSQDQFYGSVRYTKRPERRLWQGTVGYRFAPEDIVFISYKTDQEDLKQALIGYRREF